MSGYLVDSAVLTPVNRSEEVYPKRKKVKKGVLMYFRGTFLGLCLFVEVFLLYSSRITQIKS